MIGIYDYDLLATKRGLSPPSLAAMKYSAYLKTYEKDSVHLVRNIDNIATCEKVYFFSDKLAEELPKEIFLIDNIIFYGEHFEPIPRIVEHMSPDITLYNNYIQERLVEKIVSTSRALQFLDSIYYQAYTFNKERLPLPPSATRKRFYLYDKDFLSYENCWEILDEILSRSPSAIYMIHPIQCHTVKQFFTLREDYEKVSRANKIILDYFVPLHHFDLYFGKYKLKLLGEITKTSEVYVYLGKNYGNNAYGETFYIKNLYYCFNLVFSYWSRNIPIKALLFEQEEEINPYKDIYKCLRQWINSDNYSLKVCDTFNSNKLKEKMGNFIKENPVMESFFSVSKDELINTRGIWRLP